MNLSLKMIGVGILLFSLALNALLLFPNLKEDHELKEYPEWILDEWVFVRMEDLNSNILYREFESGMFTCGSIFVSFREDGRITGVRNFRNIEGRYEIDGRNMSISVNDGVYPVPSCEQVLLENIVNTTAYELLGDTLKLVQNDNTKMIFLKIQRIN